MFSGIPESAERTQKLRFKNFYQDIPEASGRHRGKHLLRKSPSDGSEETWSPRPRPIVAKFGYFKQKEQVKSRGRELKGTDFCVNDQFPKEIWSDAKFCSQSDAVLIQKGSRAVIASGRLYVDGQLYATSVPLRGYINTTPDRIRYIYLFFLSFSLVLPFTSNYLFISIINKIS